MNEVQRKVYEQLGALMVRVIELESALEKQAAELEALRAKVEATK